jgi:hypothetical protein
MRVRCATSEGHGVGEILCCCQQVPPPSLRKRFITNPSHFSGHVARVVARNRGQAVNFLRSIRWMRQGFAWKFWRGSLAAQRDREIKRMNQLHKARGYEALLDTAMARVSGRIRALLAVGFLLIQKGVRTNFLTTSF